VVNSKPFPYEFDLHNKSQTHIAVQLHYLVIPSYGAIDFVRGYIWSKAD